jgi:prevent-host-death family protein
MPKRTKPSPASRSRQRGANRSEWQLQDAKARFSELFRLARERGPQRVTRHGKTSVVVLGAEEYERLTRPKARPESLVEFFANCPLAGSGIRLDRPPDYGRTVDL